MPLLLIPLVILAFALLMALLLPFSLVQRYRLGKQRRKVWPWLNSANAWLMLVSAVMLAFSAWMATRWLPDALWMAMVGFLCGIALGLLNLAVSRREPLAEGYYLTPNAAIVLGLTLLVAARLVLAIWQLTEQACNCTRFNARKPGICARTACSRWPAC